MKKNIIIIILLGISVAFGILLVSVTKTNTKCATSETNTKEEKKSEPKTTKTQDVTGYYKAVTQVEGQEDMYEIYLALYDNNSAVISYTTSETVRYIGGYTVKDDMVILTSMYRNAHQNYGVMEDIHKFKINNGSDLIYFTDDVDGYKLDFNNIALTRIEQSEYEMSFE